VDRRRNRDGRSAEGPAARTPGAHGRGAASRRATAGAAAAWPAAEPLPALAAELHAASSRVLCRARCCPELSRARRSRARLRISLRLWAQRGFSRGPCVGRRSRYPHRFLATLPRMRRTHLAALLLPTFAVAQQEPLKAAAPAAALP